MSGIEGNNHPAFDLAARYWRRLGWDVENPASHFGGRTDLTRPEYMRADFAALISRCDAIAFLPGWTDSPGARSELVVASELGLETFDAITGLPLEVWVETAAGVTMP
jgi:hypothetical protein